MKNINLALQQTQKQIVSPQLQQAIKILQLSSIELAEKIEHELYDNPFLEEDYTNTTEENKLDEDFDKINEGNNTISIDKTIRKEPEYKNSVNEVFFEDSSDLGYIQKKTNFSNEKDVWRKQEFIENTLTINTSIYDHLLDQLKFIEISDDEFYIGEIIISSLNDDGYFTGSIEEIAKYLNKPYRFVLNTLEKIQSLDPPGIAGRNLSEVLSIQLRQRKEYTPFIEELIQNDINALEKGNLKALSLKYKVSRQKLIDALKVITLLEPIPARQFDQNETKYIAPDIIIKNEKSDDSNLIISINDAFLPNITINYDYKKLLKKEELNNISKSYFNEQYNKAKLLLFSIEKRKETIIKVVEQLVILQKDFFQEGFKHLKPLILKDIAEKINMHESTVSRVIANKYIETDWGIFPLKYFFSSKLENNGKAISSHLIKEAIKNIILKGKNTNALSDQKIALLLKESGIHIARRTVSKYRKSLKILPSFKRKD